MAEKEKTRWEEKEDFPFFPCQSNRRWDWRAKKGREEEREEEGHQGKKQIVWAGSGRAVGGQYYGGQWQWQWLKGGGTVTRQHSPWPVDNGHGRCGGFSAAM